MSSKFGVTKPKVFLSSRILGLEEIRSKIYDWAISEGYQVWIAEKCSHIDLSTPYQQVEYICLKEVREADLVICILHQGYGNTANLDVAGISLLELEIFQAILARKLIEVCILEPFQPDLQLGTLYRVLKVAVPNAIFHFRHDKQLSEHIKRRIIEASSPILSDPIELLNKFVTWLGLKRHPIGVEKHFDKGIRFLDKQFVPYLEGYNLNISLIDEIFAQLKETENYNNRLLLSWRALRHLFLVPFTQRENAKYWPLWEEAFSQWIRSAAWCGLHGHLLMGRLAAANSLLDLRGIVSAEEGTPAANSRLLSTHGVIASESYSIAKRIGSRKLFRSLLYSALSHLDVAQSNICLQKEPIGESNLLTIRASVLYKLRKFRDAISTYNRVLEIRESNGASKMQIGEAKAELGYALLSIGNFKKAKHYLEEGVQSLEEAKGAGFAIRAKRKLATYYLLTGAPLLAYRQLLETEGLIKYYDANGQTTRMTSILPQLRKIFPIKKLEVQISEKGYEYIPVA
jgi:tetratricopeptide (TPR) repeat protein